MAKETKKNKKLAPEQKKSTQAKAVAENSVKKKAPKQKSDAADIKTLHGTDAIRKRPGMYVGGIGPNAVFRMLVEGIGNVLDLFEEGAAKNLFININEKTKEITVADDAYGMPIEKLDDIMMVPHTSGKFENNGFSIGMNGVGNKVINALSEKTVVIVKRDGFKWRRTFSKGKPVGDLEKLEKLPKGEATGTTVIFKPDLEHLDDKSIPLDDYLDSLKYLDFLEKVSYLNQGLRITFHATQRKGGEINKILVSKNGLSDYLSSIQKSSLLKNHIEVKEKHEDRQIEISMNYSNKIEDEDEVIRSYVNGMETIDGGSHVQGFKMALSEVLTKYIADNNMITKKEGKIEITGDDVREGITAIVHLRWIEPMFLGQNKEKLATNEAMGFVKKAVSEQVSEWLAKNKSEAKLVCQKIIASAKGRLAAKRSKAAVKKKEGGFASVSSLSKFTKASSSDPKKKELFLVEGNSAGGTASQARDTEFQAIYRLRGKPLNTHDLESLKIMANKEFNDIISILGCGIGKDFNIDNLTHYRIIIMTDADVDGEHIQALLLTYFWKHAKQLILQGHVYVAQPPLYGIKIGGKKKYIKNLEEYNALIDKLIIEKYKVGRVIDKKPVPMSSSEVRALLKGTRQYVKKLENLSSKFALDIELLEALAMNRKRKPKELAAFLQKKFPEIGAEVTKGGVFVEGVVNENYQSVVVNDTMMGELSSIISVLDAFDLSTMFMKRGEDKIAVCTLSQFLRQAYKDVTPKERQRYKGLGEMNADQLWETTMDPENRKLVQVVVEDESNADSLFEMHMGKNADPRKEFIQSYEADPESLG